MPNTRGQQLDFVNDGKIATLCCVQEKLSEQWTCCNLCINDFMQHVNLLWRLKGKVQYYSTNLERSMVLRIMYLSCT